MELLFKAKSKAVEAVIGEVAGVLLRAKGQN
jgi:hypothetical protein